MQPVATTVIVTNRADTCPTLNKSMCKGTGIAQTVLGSLTVVLEVIDLIIAASSSQGIWVGISVSVWWKSIGTN